MSTYIRRRKQQMRNRIKLTLVLLVTAVLITFLYTIVFANAQVQGDMDLSNKAYMAVTVTADDTLWSIAQTHMNSNYYTYEQFISEVSRMNHIDNNEIFVGERILIPIVAVANTTDK